MLSAMLRALRQFLLLATAIVFAVSGIGLSYANASAVIGGGDTSHHRMTAEAQNGHRHEGQQGAPDHHHVSKMVAPCTDTSACGEGHAHLGDASSCCAMACHMALPTSSHSPSVMLAVLGKQALPPDTGGVRTLAVRLDRPPKPSSLPIG